MKILPTVTDPVPQCPALHPEVTVCGERIESPRAENGSLKKSRGFCPSLHWNYKEFGNVVGGSREEMALGIFSQRARQIAPPWSPKPLCAQTLTLDACTLPKGQRVQVPKAEPTAAGIEVKTCGHLSGSQ